MKLFKIVLLSLLCLHHQSFAFYYVHKMIGVPTSYQESYSKKHHLSKSFDKLFARGLKAYDSLNFKRAEQAYNTLLLIHSADIIALDKQSQVYLKQGKYDLAISTLHHILRIDPTYYPAHNHLSLVYLYQKNFRKSIEHCKFLIEQGEAFMETYTNLINALFFLKQYDNVVSICKIARNSGAIHPQFQFFPLLVEVLTTKSEDFIRKEGLFFVEFGKHPDINLYKYLLALVDNNSTALKEAKRAISKSSYIHPIYPHMFLTLALEQITFVSDNEANRNEAVDYSDLAISIAPDFLLPYRIEVDMLRRNGNHKSVLRLVKKALKYFPTYIPFLEFQGEAAFFTKENKLAISSFNKAFKVKKKDPSYIAYQSILLLQDGDLNQGFELAELALGIDKNNPYAQTALGLFFYKSNEQQRAQHPLNQAIKQNIAYYLPWELQIKIKMGINELRSAYNLSIQARQLTKEKSIHLLATELAFNQLEYRNCVKIARAALQLHPKEQKFIVYNAKSLYELEEYPQALAVIADKIKITEKVDPEINELHLNILMKNSLEKEAFSHVSRLLKFKPNNEIYRAFLAHFHYLQGDYKDSLDTYTKLNKLLKNNKYLYQTGWLRFLNDQDKKAISDLTSATLIGNKQTRALAFYRLALIYSFSKKTNAESSQSYSKASELVPRMKEAFEDHQLYMQLTKKSKRKEIMRQNVELYLK
ncbi:MAG: hypothetical protein KC646_07930 [Candidatus Cloacimonetes bacterium]|nr:hypothetical protein [Candidatus Cloacimonadota bacterium]